MNPKIMFDYTSVDFVLNVFNKSVDKNGYIISNMKSKKEKCGICKKPIHVKHFAGIVKDIGFVCNNITCLVNISNHVRY